MALAIASARLVSIALRAAAAVDKQSLVSHILAKCPAIVGGGESD